MTTETHPLRAAITQLTAYVAACEAGEYEDDEAYALADDALAAARAALVGSDCPREWSVRDEGGEFARVVATSADEAIDLADPTTDASDFADSTETVHYTVRAVCQETDESDSRDITAEPSEPSCTEDAHDWRSPVEIVGGIRENPGVWGHGGGVVIHEVCMHCGCGRTTDTWAQHASTGEQGLTSVSHDPGEYVEALEDYRATRVAS